MYENVNVVEVTKVPGHHSLISNKHVIIKTYCVLVTLNAAYQKDVGKDQNRECCILTMTTDYNYNYIIYPDHFVLCKAFSNSINF